MTQAWRRASCLPNSVCASVKYQNRTSRSWGIQIARWLQLPMTAWPRPQGSKCKATLRLSNMRHGHILPSSPRSARSRGYRRRVTIDFCCCLCPAVAHILYVHPCYHWSHFRPRTSTCDHLQARPANSPAHSQRHRILSRCRSWHAAKRATRQHKWAYWWSTCACPVCCARSYTLLTYSRRRRSCGGKFWTTSNWSQWRDSSSQAWWLGYC